MMLTTLVAVLGVISLSNSLNINITSPPITNWGVWGNFERCPNGRYVQGFQLKTEPNQFLGDDTALNAIRLFCGDPYRPDTAVITSTVGDFGVWGHVYTCYPGVLTGFQLRVESNRLNGDDTATNNARFTCSENPNESIEGDGMYWGDWSDYQNCQSGQAICGIQTQIEPYLDDGDDTMLNNVRLECCDYRQSELQDGYDYVREKGAYPQKLSPEFAALLRKAVADELDNTVSHEEKLQKLNLAKLIRAKTAAFQKEQPVEKTETVEPLNIGEMIKGISEAIKKEQIETSRKENEQISALTTVAKLLQAHYKISDEKQVESKRVDVNITA